MREPLDTSMTDEDRLRNMYYKAVAENENLRVRIIELKRQFASRPKLVWSNEPPQVSGRYLYRRHSGANVQMFYVDVNVDPASPRSIADGELWLGPIPEPIEPKGGRNDE